MEGTRNKLPGDLVWLIKEKRTAAAKGRNRGSEAIFDKDQAAALEKDERKKNLGRIYVWEVINSSGGERTNNV